MKTNVINWIMDSIENGKLDENQVVVVYDKNNNIEYLGKAQFAPLCLWDEFKRAEYVGNELRINERAEMKYNYTVYVKDTDADYSNDDKIYSRVVCTPFEIARYVEQLKEDLNRISKTAYYIRGEFDKVLIGYTNGYPVWYKTYDCIMYCQPLNLLITGISNIESAYEKCKTFKNFEYAKRK